MAVKVAPIGDKEDMLGGILGKIGGNMLQDKLTGMLGGIGGGKDEGPKKPSGDMKKDKAEAKADVKSQIEKTPGGKGATGSADKAESMADKYKPDWMSKPGEGDDPLSRRLGKLGRFA